MTKFKGTPLFGQDSIPQNTSSVIAIIGTVIFWLLLLISLIFIKPIEKKPKYKEVQIVLSSTPKVKQEEAPAPAQAAPSVAEEVSPIVEDSAAVVNEVQKSVETQKAVEVQKPVETLKTIEVPKPVETPKAVEKKTNEKPVQKTESKPAAPEKKAVSSEKTPVVTEPVEYAKDMTDFSFSNTPVKQNKVVDWDAMFADDTSTEAVASESVKKVQNNEPQFSGSAASAAESTSQSVTSTSSSKSTTQKASSSTSNALAKISDANFEGKAVNGVTSQTNVKSAQSGNGKVMLEMSNGSSRALLDPEKPVINLSQAASATIDGSRTVKIRFRVVEQGNVPRGEIKITPESVLTELVRTEIFDQISKWRFEPDNYSAYAEFEYKIVKK